VRRILLIRHGETAGNAARVVQKPDIPLSPRGEAQADALARRLAGDGITQIFSSDLERAAATARRLRATTSAPIAFDPLLQERNFGDVRGTPYDQLGFDLFEPDYAPPNGETWEMFHARVDQAWERIQAMAASTAGTLAVVTHGLVCRSIAARHVRLADGMLVPEKWENTSVTIVDAQTPWRVSMLNDIAHLENPELRPSPGAAV
jgi:broad specificity phosphatase PhoE